MVQSSGDTETRRHIPEAHSGRDWAVGNRLGLVLLTLLAEAHLNAVTVAVPSASGIGIPLQMRLRRIASIALSASLRQEIQVIENLLSAIKNSGQRQLRPRGNGCS